MKFGIVVVIAFLIDYGLMVALTEFFGVPYLSQQPTMTMPKWWGSCVLRPRARR